MRIVAVREQVEVLEYCLGDERECLRYRTVGDTGNGICRVVAAEAMQHAVIGAGIHHVSAVLMSRTEGRILRRRALQVVRISERRRAHIGWRRIDEVAEDTGLARAELETRAV